MVNCVLVAINSGGVIVGKDFVFNASDQAFAQAFTTFKVKHHGFFSFFLSESDLESMTKMVQLKRQA